MEQPQWEAQLEELVEMAFKEGLAKAVEKARKINDPFLLDKFHDTLTNELRDALIEQQHKGK
ncbi:hypothetical protein C4553_01830 [Candidatus Parcubacteria bacterium]|nr:MAG: hypothetical protein C4553_01830 [Candidatus Parcubacteria bacterium]